MTQGGPIPRITKGKGNGTPFLQETMARQDALQAEYARSYRTLWERHWWWRSREAMVLGWIERLQRRAPLRRILDVGCGDGLFFDRLERFGADVEGLEPDAGLLQDPRWRSRIRNAPIGPGVCDAGASDLVLMLDVLEHIADDRAAMRAVRDALRPGGHLLMTVPALPWLWSRHDDANEHHRRYGLHDLRRVLDESGLVVESIRFFFAWTVVPMVVRRLLVPAGPGEDAGMGVGAKGGTADYAVTIPPAPINRALWLFSCAEHVLGRLVRWPLGSSLLAVARRPRPEET
jgi:SAM-dependent methyltransferase